MSTNKILASRETKPEDTIITLSREGREEVKIGRNCPQVVMAGPCSAETEEMVFRTAEAVRQAGAKVLRGGAFKPRTSPYDFQGRGESALKWLRKAADEYGLYVVTEVLSTDLIDLVAEYADILQIGSRNMQNFDLLAKVGRHESRRPVLLKRAKCCTYKEWLMATEYVLAGGNPNVILCERGVTGDNAVTRNVLDLTAVPVMRAMSHLPIIVDPSHGIGLREHVPMMAGAALMAGADGLIIEVHPDPSKALSDGRQSMTPAGFEVMMTNLKPVMRLARNWADGPAVYAPDPVTV